MRVKSTSPASKAISAVFSSSMGKISISSKSGCGPFQSGFLASTVFCFGVQDLRR